MTRAAAGTHPRGVLPSSPPDRPTSRVRSALRGDRLWVVAAQIAVVAAFLVAWELAAQAQLINPRFLGQPTLVFERILELVGGAETYGDDTIWHHIRVTLSEIIPGYALGSVLGLGVGFLFARSALVAAVLEPYILSIYSIPKIALAPVFILFFGIEETSKIAIVVVGVFFMVFFNTYAGVAGVNEEHVYLARIMGARRRDLVRRVILPSAAPAIMTGFKMAVPFSMIGAIVGEFIASFEGLGFFIKQATVLVDASGLVAGIFFLVLMTWLLTQSIAVIEGYILRWQPRRAVQQASA